MSKCVCEGNWRELVKDYEPHFGKTVEDKDGNRFVFEGLLWAADDYYFVLTRNKNVPMFETCCWDLFRNYKIVE